jgi:hypothetical protein
VRLDYFNTQGQVKFVWPKSFSLARAYVDQLERSNSLTPARIADIREGLDAAEKNGQTGQADLTHLATQLDKETVAAGERTKVGMLADAVRELAAGPHLARQ